MLKFLFIVLLAGAPVFSGEVLEQIKVQRAAFFGRYSNKVRGMNRKTKPWVNDYNVVFMDGGSMAYISGFISNYKRVRPAFHVADSLNDCDHLAYRFHGKSFTIDFAKTRSMMVISIQPKLITGKVITKEIVSQYMKSLIKDTSDYALVEDNSLPDFDRSGSLKSPEFDAYQHKAGEFMKKFNTSNAIPDGDPFWKDKFELGDMKWGVKGTSITLVDVLTNRLFSSQISDIDLRNNRRFFHAPRKWSLQEEYHYEIVRDAGIKIVNEKLMPYSQSTESIKLEEDERAFSDTVLSPSYRPPKGLGFVFLSNAKYGKCDRLRTSYMVGKDRLTITLMKHLFAVQIDGDDWTRPDLLPQKKIREMAKNIFSLEAVEVKPTTANAKSVFGAMKAKGWDRKAYFWQDYMRVGFVIAKSNRPGTFKLQGNSDWFSKERHEGREKVPAEL